MDKYIKQLIELDKENLTVDENIKTINNSFYHTLEQKKKEVYDEMWEKAKSEIALEIENLKKQLKQEELETIKDCENKKEILSKKFNENKERWTQEIFERVLK